MHAGELDGRPSPTGVSIRISVHYLTNTLVKHITFAWPINLDISIATLLTHAIQKGNKEGGQYFGLSHFYPSILKSISISRVSDKEWAQLDI